MIERQYLTSSSHVETECPRRKVNCQYCHDTGEHQFIEGQHKEECPAQPICIKEQRYMVMQVTHTYTYGYSWHCETHSSQYRAVRGLLDGPL